jgi:4-amino-4-deoxy-L-arabinose transferase-like glycosyltransferase
MKLNQKIEKYFWWVIFVIIIVFLVTRFIGLTNLPVFADEAIYIRWAQMIVNQPKEYFFIPMYDGKPPLHMWLLTRFLPFTPLDPLWSARFMSVVAGLLTMSLLMILVKELGGKTKAILLTGLLYLVLPFTIFHDRLALIDSLFTLLLTGTFLALVITKRTQSWLWAIVVGIFFGLSLLSKTPALFFIPVMVVGLFLIPPQIKSKLWAKQVIMLGLSIIIGFSIFYSLKVSPLFPFLFQRSGDFTFTISEVIGGEWRIAFKNLLIFLRWQLRYLSFCLLILPFISVWLGSKSKSWRSYWLPLSLLLVAFIFTLPFIIFGRVVFSRYYLPIIIFLIPAAAISLERLVLGKKYILSGVLIGFIAIQSLYFIGPLYTDISRIPLAPEDIHQYLTSWSAGFGNLEVRDYLNQVSQSEKVVVATEGYFGTLPDGLLMYFDKSPQIVNLEIFGMGYPLAAIPDEIVQKAQDHPLYLVFNQDRINMDVGSCCDIVATYPRPYNAAPLVLLKYKSN